MCRVMYIYMHAIEAREMRRVRRTSALILFCFTEAHAVVGLVLSRSSGLMTAASVHGLEVIGKYVDCSPWL